MSANKHLAAIDLLEQALELPSADVPAFLDGACEGDPQLRASVEALLKSLEHKSDFLAAPGDSQQGTDPDSVAEGETSVASSWSGIGRLTPGDLLQDRYRITETIGFGGMGEVYRAVDSRLDRDVAIKVLNGASLVAEGMAERFEREVKSVASLAHPNIVALFDVADHEDIKFAVLEFVSGTTLKDAVAGGMDWQTAARLTHGIALGLAAAHAKNLMHRDIKPANVVVADDGRPRILDFGLARHESVQADQELTGTAALIPGTVPYMSPEQARGRELTCATDIFSLGIACYEMLTGRNPFRAETALETMHNICHEAPRAVRELVEGVPKPIEDLVTSMLSLDPGDRPTADEVALCLSARFEVDDTPFEPSWNGQLDANDGRAKVNNLPARRVELTGRESELNAVGERLSANPIVTVVGPGGVGKTSLALEVARRTVDAYPGGVWFCELAPTRQAEDVAEVLASVLDGNAGSLSGVDEVVAKLDGQPTLLVFDNCEHVIDAVADLVETLSDRLTALKILATSRESLSVVGESVCRLSGLECEGTTSDAVNLFVSRATALSGFEDRPGNRQLVQQVVSRLEGLPLAIELAAPRLATMSLAELNDALDDQLSTLRGRRSKDRQATLDRAIAWSFDLLEPAEQEMLLDLSVFAASFTNDGALAVCKCGSAGRQRLQRLVEQSVVVRFERMGVSRFRLLEPIRQFCQTRVASESLAKTRRNHATFYAARASQLSVGISGDGELLCADALNVEWPDLRVAVAWGRENRMAEIAVDPIVALARTIMFHLRAEAYQWMMDAVEVIGSELLSRADVNYVIGNGLWLMGNTDEGERHLNRSLEIEPTSQAHFFLFLLHFSCNRYAQAADAMRKGGDVAQANNDELESRWFLNSSWRACALSMQNPQDPQVDAIMKPALTFMAGLDWPTGQAVLNMSQGTIAMMRRDLDAAHRFISTAMSLCARAGNRWGETVFGLVADGVADAATPPEERLRSATEHLRMLVDTGEEAHLPLAIRSVIVAMVHCGHPEIAAKCSAIVPLVTGVGDKNELSPMYRPALDEASQTLGQDRFAVLQKDGVGLTVQEIADLAETLASTDPLDS